MSDFNDDLLSDLDLDMDLDSIEMDPEFVDLTPGAYILRVAGATNKAIELENDDGDTVPSSRLSIVFQIVQVVAAEMPAPEAGGLFTVGGIMAYKRARSQVFGLATKAVKLANPDFFSVKRTPRDLLQEVIRLYSDINLLECNITLRNEKYPQIRTMRLRDISSVEVDWDSYQKAEFEFHG